MTLFNLDIGSIVELGTRVATTGTIRALEATADNMFEYVVAVAVVIYEQDPDG